VIQRKADRKSGAFFNWLPRARQLLPLADAARGWIPVLLASAWRETLPFVISLLPGRRGSTVSLPDGFRGFDTGQRGGFR
jgi:hypothetical protein